MNQVKTPSDRLKKSINMHPPPQHASSPQPRAPLTCLSHPWQAVQGTKEQGGTAATAPQTKHREAAAGDKAHSQAATGVRNALARPIVWGPLCSSNQPPPTSVPNRTGRNIGSRTEKALLKEALTCKKPPALAWPYVPVWHMGLHSFCPRGQVGSRGLQSNMDRQTDPGVLFICAHRALAALLLLPPEI